MRILILNWRDPNNPKAGGAEVVNLALARQWIAAGHEVTWFSARFPGAAAEETIQGVRVLRRGRPWTVHWWAFWAYLRRTLRGHDLVIDQIHGIGFLTPLYVREPRLALIYEVAGSIWFKMYSLPGRARRLPAGAATAAPLSKDAPSSRWPIRRSKNWCDWGFPANASRSSRPVSRSSHRQSWRTRSRRPP